MTIQEIPDLISETKFILFDTELTGLNERKDSLLSIGAVRMKGGSILLGETFERLIRPDSKISKESILIHQITPSEVSQQSGADEVLEDFFTFCGDAVMVGHFVALDQSFIAKKRLEILSRPVVDTVSLLRWLKQNTKHTHKFGDDPNYSLFEIARTLGISLDQTHRALGDAYITAQIFQRFLPLLAEAGIIRTEELLKIGAPFKGGADPAAAGTFSGM